MSSRSPMRGRTLLAGAATLALVLTLAAGPGAAADPRPAYAPGEVLVGFKKNSSQGARDAALAKAKGRILKQLATELDLDEGEPGVHRIKTTLPVEAAIDALSKDPNVAYAEPNWAVQHTADANDTYYANGSLWGMYGDDLPTAAGPAGTTNVYGCDAESAWAAGTTGSSTVYVGVIDEGFQAAHADLAGNVWTNPYDPVDGVDNDGNGFIDDKNGWDFWNGDNSVYDAADGDDHGTHVAGTIGATGDNGTGVAGVNWDVTLISCKFLGPPGGYLSDAIAALDYLRDLKERHGLRIVAASNSWGGGGYSSALHGAILRAAKQGILFVAAAGNAGTNNDASPSYPSNYSTLSGTISESAASYEAVIAVAAIDSAGNKASWSSYGATTVDLGAPGVSILSTVPGGYSYYSGTSMATPHVSGAVALYASAFPAATASEIRAALLANTIATSSLSGKTVTGGRLNLAGLFGEPDPPADPPAELHDVAVGAVSVPGSVKRGKTVTVNVAVSNQGTTSETIQVSIAATAGTVSSPKSVPLAAGANTSVSFSWTAPNVKTTCTITATAATVAGETDTSDNARSTSTNVR
jgi:subtilisin family serine protease